MVWQTAGLGAMPAVSVVAVDPVHAPKKTANRAPRPGTIQPLAVDHLLKIIQTR